MKIYVDKKEEGLIEDSLYADNTRLILNNNLKNKPRKK